tara:strand:- start:1987 stop:2274 length:288 start_codon:yes stop_codon:yes gene_type:complete
VIKENNILNTDNKEVKELKDAIKNFNNHNFFKIYNSIRTILYVSFLKGLVSGLGWILGATILVSLLTYTLSQIEFIPILGDLVSQLISEIEAFER